MPKKKSVDAAQKKVDKDWQEILDSVNMDFLPIQYVETIIVYFNDGRVWNIDVDKQRAQTDRQHVEDSLEAFFEEYEQSISNVDFRLDFQQLKKDISRRTKRFLKLNK